MTLPHGLVREFDRCVVFFDEGRTQVIYAVDAELISGAENYIRKGVPFLVVKTKDLPSRETRDSWKFDYKKPSGYGKNTGKVTQTREAAASHPGHSAILSGVFGKE